MFARWMNAAAVAIPLALGSVFAASCAEDQRNTPGKVSGMGGADGVGPAGPDKPDVMAWGAQDTLPTNDVAVAATPPPDVFVPPAADTAQPQPVPPAPKLVPWDQVVVDPIDLPGELQQLAAGRRQVNGKTETGCFAVSSHPGQFKKPPRLSLAFISSIGQVTLLSQQIPNAFDPQTGQARFGVNSLLQNQAGNLLLALQSTEGAGVNPDGSVQQVWVLGPDGQVVGQHDFLVGALPHYRPQVVVQSAEGVQFVLLNNCDPTVVLLGDKPYVPCSQDSALAVFKTPDLSDQPTIYPLIGVRNAGALTLVGDQLIIAAAGNVHVDPSSVGQLVSLNAAALKGTSKKESISLPGVGLGSTQVALQGGVILFTVNNSSWAPEAAKPAVVLLKDQQTVSLPLPAQLAFVAGAVFAGDEVLLTGHTYDPKTKAIVTGAYRTHAGGTPILLPDGEKPSFYSVGVVTYDEDGYCYGAAGTSKVADGTLYSTVMMVHP